MELVTFAKYLLLLRCIYPDIVVKRRLCVDAVVDNYHSDAPVLDTWSHKTDHSCCLCDLKNAKHSSSDMMMVDVSCSRLLNIACPKIEHRGQHTLN